MIEESAIDFCCESGEKANSPCRKIRLLLAEDTRATRELLLAAFDRERYTIDVAVNGQDAFDQFRNSEYDVVLTDIQMPILDGLTATKRMRALESAQPNRSRTPIIAITAGASDADREACLAAGMDAFFPKPIDLPRLFDTIIKVAQRSSDGDRNTADEAVEKAGISPACQSSLDMQAALKRLQGDHELFRALASFFVDDHQELLGQVRAGIREGDLAAIRRSTHALKGMASGVGAESVVEAIAGIESKLASGTTGSILKLESEIDKAVRELKLLLKLH